MGMVEIWITTLQGTRCGYDKFVWDHRLLWLEILLAVALGHNDPPIVRATALRLKCEDPKVVQKLNILDYRRKHSGYQKGQGHYQNGC
jgi:hypothetical protein